MFVTEGSDDATRKAGRRSSAHAGSMHGPRALRELCGAAGDGHGNELAAGAECERIGQLISSFSRCEAVLIVWLIMGRLM